MKCVGFGLVSDMQWPAFNGFESNRTEPVPKTIPRSNELQGEGSRSDVPLRTFMRSHMCSD